MLVRYIVIYDHRELNYGVMVLANGINAIRSFIQIF